MLHQDHHHGPPHAALLAAVVLAMMVVPTMIGEQGEAILESVSEVLSPIGLLLLPIGLLLVIQLLSGGTAFSGVFSGGGPDSIHRVSGSPVGVALFLVIILCLLYIRVSIFGGGDDEE